jgi:hypothetical protein
MARNGGFALKKSGKIQEHMTMFEFLIRCEGSIPKNPLASPAQAGSWVVDSGILGVFDTGTLFLRHDNRKLFAYSSIRLS